VRLAQSGKAASVQAWIYRTFLNLSAAGADVELCHRIPDEGIVVALTGNLGNDFKSPGGIFLIGVVADGAPHPACHVHVLQNAIHAERLPHSTYIPHWPQPNLVPRDQGRGDTLENLVFYGDPCNLAPGLRDPSFSRILRERLGMTLVIAGADSWHDYSNADCVIAIREFGSRRFLGKPATKLYNAWMAGVPFIGGNDSAFSSDGRDGIDYLRCNTLESVFTGLERLKNNPDFCRQLVMEGSFSARRFTPEAITDNWSVFLRGVVTTMAPEYFSQYQTSKRLRRLFHRFNLLIDGCMRGF
jgi:hypothetical protein